jgi:hypothetical protein
MQARPPATLAIPRTAMSKTDSTDTSFISIKKDKVTPVVTLISAADVRTKALQRKLHPNESGNFIQKRLP